MDSQKILAGHFAGNPCGIFDHAATIAPWTIRNYNKFHLFIPISHNGGYVLYLNNNDYNWSGGWIDPRNFAVSEEFKQKFVERGTTYPQHPPQTDDLFKKEATKWIVTHPVEFVKLGTIRIKNTFFNGATDIEKWTMNQIRAHERYGLESVHFERNLNLFKSVSDVIVYVISSFGLIYTLLNLRHVLTGLFRRQPLVDYGHSVVTLNIAFFAAVYFATEGQARYNFPTLFFLVIATVTCIGVLAGARGVGGSRTSEQNV